MTQKITSTLALLIALSTNSLFSFDLADAIVKNPHGAAEYIAKAAAQVFTLHRSSDREAYLYAVDAFSGIFAQLSDINTINKIQKDPKACATWLFQTYSQIHTYIKPSELAEFIARERCGYTTPQQIKAFTACYLIMHQAVLDIAALPHSAKATLVNETFIKLFMQSIISAHYSALESIDPTLGETEFSLQLVVQTLLNIKKTVSMPKLAAQAGIKDSATVQVLTQSWKLLLNACEQCMRVPQVYTLIV